jgi:signal transduction histidine kinase
MEGAYGNRERHDKARAIFVRADTQLKRISRLVEDLLDVSRIRAGRLELNDEELDLTALVHGTVERMSETFASASCELLLESQGPVVGKFDRFRLEQVVVNLVMNAIKYASRHPVHIGVLAVEGQAVISVRDEGPGINLEQQRTLFERFDRGSAPKGTPGLGLGLYIVRQIVAAHGGTIGVESQEGRGCVFTVRLPLRRAG